MVAVLHSIHDLAAGIWLGGLVFTTTVVTPAFNRMDWTPAERTAVRTAVGHRYARVAPLNLAILTIAAILEWARRGWNAVATIEIALIVAVILLCQLHARVLAPRLGLAARSGDEAARRGALRLSIAASVLNLLLSLLVCLIAAVR